MHLSVHRGASLVAQMVNKEYACSVGDLGLISGWERSPGEGQGNPVQYSCLENSMHRGVWQATARGVAESDATERLTLSHSVFIAALFRTAKTSVHQQMDG